MLPTCIENFKLQSIDNYAEVDDGVTSLYNVIADIKVTFAEHIVESCSATDVYRKTFFN